jgi:hypothetical protein
MVCGLLVNEILFGRQPHKFFQYLFRDCRALRSQQKPIPVFVNQLDSPVARNVKGLSFAEKTGPEALPAILGNRTVLAHRGPGDSVPRNLLVLPLEREEAVIITILSDGGVESQKGEKNGNKQNKAGRKE